MSCISDICRMFDGPVGRDVAATLVEKAPAQYEWPTIVEKNKVCTYNTNCAAEEVCGEQIRNTE